MKKKILWITETAVMLAALVALQAITKPLGQLVTGSCVNTVLAVTVLLAGLNSGLTVALISPVVAYMLNIAPQPVVVIPIMLANVCYVVILHLLLGRSWKPAWKPPLALAAAAGVKFGVLYLAVVKLICGVAAQSLIGQQFMGKPLLTEKMILPAALPAMFSWMQLVTALIGGAVALLIVPALRKGLKRL